MKKMEWKVGLFVLLGLVLTGLMIIRFNKGTGLSSTYNLNLEAGNASGIIRGAGVLMAGVPIGSVSEIYLAEDGSKVTMVASIYDQYKISSNAVIGIGTVGFLGDRYISVSPGPRGKQTGDLQPDSTVRVAEAFDFSTVAETASGLMARLSGTVDQLSNAVTRLDKTIISEESLDNLTETIANFRGMSARARGAVGGLEDFVRTNAPTLNHSLTNVHLFTEKLNSLAADLQQTVATNRVEFTAAIKNIERATQRADRILAEVEQGKGLAGSLLSNEQMANYTSLVLSNFMVLSSNVNHKGLWGVIRKPKSSREDE